MAAYDYRCRACDTVFTVQRAMSDVATAVRCPRGHDDVARMWSAVSITGKASARAGASAASAAGTGAAAGSGACCGGGCCG